MAFAVTPEGRETSTGVELSVRVPSPTSPKPLSPQASDLPVGAKGVARTATAGDGRRGDPRGSDTCTGVVLQAMLTRHVSGPLLVPSPAGRSSWYPRRTVDPNC